MSEAKGPYSENNYVGEPPDAYRLVDSRDAIIANLSFAAGRASRDGLREALVAISSELYVNVDAATRCRQLAKKALADDEEGK